MTEFLTSAQMRAIERAAIDSGQVTGLELMERAGQGVLDAVFATWPDFARAPATAFLLCGPGNNGGDGHVIARVLAQAGWTVTIAQDGPPLATAPDALACYHKAQAAGCAFLPLSAQLARDIAAEAAPVLVVDALFGTGLTRPLVPEMQALAAELAQSAARSKGAIRVVAVDIPSGLSADTGQVIAGPEGGRAFRADLTVTFHDRKRGHMLQDGPAHCGRIEVVDIGLGPWDGLRHGA